MQENRMLEDIAARLDAKTIHEVRRIARQVGAHSESSQKSSIIDAILGVAGNTMKPHLPSKRGAPPKSEDADLKIVADVRLCRQYYIALESGDDISKFSVNDSGANFAKSVNFETLKRIYPDKLLTLKGDISCRVINMFAPVVLGQRAFISGSANTGKTFILKSIAKSVYNNYCNILPVILIVDARPEEISDFKRDVCTAEYFCTSFDMPPANHINAVLRATEFCKREIEKGKNVMLFTDGLFGGYIPEETLKKLLYFACNTEEGVSLTIISTIDSDSAQYSNFIKTATAQITLSSELSRARVFPAIDVKNCFVDMEEKILAPQEFAQVNAIREQVDSREIINLFKTTQTNSEVLEKHKNG